MEKECSICGESKDICPNEETCSYRIEYEDTKNDFMEDKLKQEKPKNNFEEYGLKCKNKEFEGEIFNIVKDKGIDRLVGYFKDDKNHSVIPCTWHKNGEVRIIGNFEDYDNKGKHKYDLTPIKKEWYEKKENFPCIVIRKDGFGIPLVVNRYVYTEENDTHWLVYEEMGEDIYSLNAKHYRPATEEEVSKLIVKEK